MRGSSCTCEGMKSFMARSANPYCNQLWWVVTRTNFPNLGHGRWGILHHTHSNYGVYLGYQFHSIGRVCTCTTEPKTLPRSPYKEGRIYTNLSLSLFEFGTRHDPVFNLYCQIVPDARWESSDRVSLPFPLWGEFNNRRYISKYVPREWPTGGWQQQRILSNYLGWTGLDLEEQARHDCWVFEQPLFPFYCSLTQGKVLGWNSSEGRPPPAVIPPLPLGRFAALMPTPDGVNYAG